MHFTKELFLVVVISTLAGCKTQQVIADVSAEQLSNIIAKKLGDSSSRINNHNNSYVLGWREDNTSGTLVIRYGVWDIKTGQLIYANTLLRGSVQWLDNTSLLVEEYPGIIKAENQNYKFKIDLNTKVKTPLHEKEDL